MSHQGLLVYRCWRATATTYKPIISPLCLNLLSTMSDTDSPMSRVCSFISYCHFLFFTHLFHYFVSFKKNLFPNCSATHAKSICGKLLHIHNRLPMMSASFTQHLPQLDISLVFISRPNIKIVLFNVSLMLQFSFRLKYQLSRCQTGRLVVWCILNFWCIWHFSYSAIVTTSLQFFDRSLFSLITNSTIFPVTIKKISKE